MEKDDKKKNDTNIVKKKYIKPTLETEDLTSFGALCNGTTAQRRKASTSRPDRCRASRLNS